MDLSALRTLEYAKIRRMDVVGNGRRVNPQQFRRNPAVSADGCPSALTAWILLRNRRPCLCPGIVTFTAGLCTVPTSMSSPPVFCRFKGSNARSMFIPPKVSRVSENFGGINMDLSALRTLEYAKIREGQNGSKQRPVPGRGQGPEFAAESKPLAPMGAHRR